MERVYKNRESRLRLRASATAFGRSLMVRTWWQEETINLVRLRLPSGFTQDEELN
jgi:hypothetical protein